MEENLHSRHEVGHLSEGAPGNEAGDDLHAGLVVVLPDVLQDGVQALQGGGGEHLLPQLVVENVELLRDVLQLPPDLGMGGHCNESVKSTAIQERNVKQKTTKSKFPFPKLPNNKLQ